MTHESLSFVPDTEPDAETHYLLNDRISARRAGPLRLSPRPG